jgi:uncharacterized membrane protein
MNKKTRTIIFIIAATVFNIVIFFAVFAAFFAFYIFIVAPYMLSDDGLSGFITPIMILIFVLAIVISFLVYRAALNRFFIKVDAEQYFDPLFVKQNRKKDKISKDTISDKQTVGASAPEKI